MKDILLSLWKLMIGDLTPEERKVLTGAVLKVGWRGALAFHILWACGWLAFVGLGAGFALADDTDQKIAKAVEPIRKEQAEQRAMLTNLTDVVSDQIVSAIAGEIRLLYSKRCKETSYQERDRLQGEIDKKQREYRKYRENNYTFGCNDL